MSYASRTDRIANNSTAKRRIEPQLRRFSRRRPKRLDSTIFGTTVCLFAVILTISATPSRVIPALAQGLVSNDPGNESGRPIRFSQEIGGAYQATAISTDLAEEGAPFKAFLDHRRTLHIEGTNAAETIIAEVFGDPSSMTIEYRTDGTREPRKLSFRLDTFDRLVLNARGGADFVNIIDAAELLSARRKVLKLDAGDGDNIVVLSHLPFKPETAKQMMRLRELSKLMEDVAKRGSEATSQALTGDAMRLIESVRVNLADVSKSMASDAEKQLFGRARELVDGSGPRLADLGKSIVAKSDNLAKQHGSLVEELTKKYHTTNGGSPPDYSREPPDALRGKPDDDSDSSAEDEESDGEPQADHLLQVGLKLGDDARAQVERMGKRMQDDAADIEQRAAGFAKRVEQLSTAADLLAARGEQDMTAAANRVRSVVAELKSMEESFREAGLALSEELQMAASIPTAASQAKVANVAAASCGTPIVTTNTYTGSGFFLPIAAPWSSWSITGGVGTDLLIGGFAADDIHGGPGNDFVFGLSGNDHIHGDDGNDLLVGEFLIDFPSITGDDCIWGDNGTDVVVGDNLIELQGGTAGGDDQLRGGKGVDIVVGDDVLDVPNFPNFNPVLLEILSQTHPGGKDKLEGNDDIDLLFGCGGADNIKGNADIDFAEGNGGADVIEGGKGRNFAFCNTTVEIGNLLLGGRGADKVTGGSGIDVIFGEQDADTLIGAGQVDLMFGGSKNDKMYGDAGGLICIINGIPIRLGNLMLGGTEDDNMRAGGDLDAMFGQDGEDKIYGYDGSFQQPSAIDADWISGGNGNDYLEGDNESLSLLFSIDFIIGGPGNDDMRGGKLIDFMLGGTGADTMRGDSNKVLLVTSIDLMFGGPDGDWMDGGNGLDLMLGEGGSDTLRGDDERSLLISPDLMFGGPGIDRMNGGSSPDFMSGGDAADNMRGDSNLVWQPFSIDFMLGGPGPDFMDGGNSMDFMWGGDGCDTMLGDNSTAFRISPDFMFGDAGNDDMDGGNSTDFMFGGPDDDRVVGDRQFSSQLFSSDWLWGDDGCDTLLGGRALDVIFGGNGVDEIDGQRGPDVISGGPGSDTINGGDSLDFIWGDEANDLIHGDDFLDLIRGGDGNDCIYGDGGPDSVWGNEGDDCIHGGNGPDHLRGNRDNDLIFGDNGWDRLRGGNGDDKLDGGAGFDLIFGGSGNDEGWRGSGGALFFSVATRHNGSSGLDCNCQIDVCEGKICVHKFNDINGDGIQNSGEPDLQNWVFQVIGPCVATTLITDANGNACGDFAGIYTVVEQMQSGWTATTPTTVTVMAGQTTPVNFGNKQSNGELCIYKFHDLNGNGVRDTGEPVLPNWSFTVTNSSGVSTTFVTDSLGRICKAFPAGTYTVAETPQTGWTATTPSTQTVTVTAGATTPVTFGNKQSNGELCIYKFHDLNGNGVRDTGEPVLPNWSFTVTNSSGVSTTFVTDSLGRICKAFPAGTYTVAETPQTGWTATTPSTQTVTVTAGATTNVTFGNKQSNGELCIYKFHDLNGNGVRDTGEPVLPNWSFTVTNSSGVSTTFVTDSLGRICKAFPAGTYTVAETPQTGWTATTPTMQTVTVTAGQTTTLYFGNQAKTGPSACATPPPGMVAWWPLDETSGSVVHSIVGNHDGITQPGPIGSGNLWVAPAPKVGSAVFFGVARAEVPDDPALNFGTGDFSIDAWVRSYQSTLLSAVVDKLDTSTTTHRGYAFFVQGGMVQLRIGDGLSTGTYQSSNTFVADGTWRHVAVTMRRVGGTPVGQFYIDGVPAGSFQPLAINLDNSAKLLIGSFRLGNNACSCEVSLDEIELFNRALTPAEVQSIASAGSAGKCKTGSLTATKTVKNLLLPFPIPAGTNFPITVSCLPSGPNVTLNLAAGGTQTVNNIPVGSTCTVTEGALPPPSPHPACANAEWGTPTYAPGQTVTIPSTGGPQTVTVTNTYSCITTPSCATPPPGMVAWWPMDLQNSLVNDIALPPDSIVNNWGSSPAPQPVFGNVGGASGALYFSRTPGALLTTPVQVSPQSELDFGTGDFSIDAWVRIASAAPGSVSPIVDKFTPMWGEPGFALYVRNQKLELNVNGITFVSTAPNMSFADPVLNTGPWYHVAVTVKRSPTQVVFYINGGSAGTFAAVPAVPATSVNNGSPLWIGGIRRMPAGIIAGGIAIDELELFKRELSQTEIQSIFNAKSVGKCK